MVDTSTGGTAPRSTRDDAEREARNLTDEARQTGREAYDRASGEARAQGDAAKHRAADEVTDISGALRRAAEESRDGSPQQQAFGRVAEGLADFSDEMRQKSFGDAARELDGFARRNPLAFLGGAALLGFAATRFAKASASHPEGAYGSSYGDASRASRDPHGGSVPRGPEAGGTVEPRPATPPVKTGSEIY